MLRSIQQIEFFTARDAETGETFRDYMKRTGMSMESALHGQHLAEILHGAVSPEVTSTTDRQSRPWVSKAVVYHNR